VASAKPTARRGPRSGALDWLLTSDQPAVRYYALTDLAERRENDEDVRRARSNVGRVGWARDLLATQKAKGFWEAHEPKTLREYVNFLRFPAFQSSVWKGLVLADLGLTSGDPRVRRFADLVFQYLLPLSSPFNLYTEEACIVGNVAGMMTRFGYGDDRRVRKLYDWMVEDQREDGGWNCAANAPGTLDAWEPLAAFATLPKEARPAAVERAIARGAEFYLDRKLLEEGRRYAPWFRLHYPRHYFYDVLVGLDVLTRLGFAGDRRLRPGLELLRQKRRPDGSWALDRVHPDGPAPGNLKKMRPLALERVGEPSQWITLTALQVLKRVDDANGHAP
jgi:hypothetical protein